MLVCADGLRGSFEWVERLENEAIEVGRSLEAVDRGRSMATKLR